MPALILYLLKVNVALVLFYLAYHVALRRLTFYHLNRLFLLFAIAFSSVYPLIDLSELFSQHEELTNTYMVSVPVWTISTQALEQTPRFDYWQIPLILFWTGTTVMAIRLFMQFVSLYKIHAASRPAKHKNISFRQVNSISYAFSFWQTIYINPTKHKSEDLESILQHELIHITGWHTLDVLLAELSIVFYWFNPGVWLMNKAIKENLEFIADQNVVNTGVDKKEYQYLLLKVVGATQPQIANQFNFPSLKRRITMMNKMPTKKANQLRLLIALPLVAVLLVAFRSASEPIEPNTSDIILNNSKEQQTKQQEAKEEFLKRNPTIEDVTTELDENRAFKIAIILKSGIVEHYDINKEDRALAEKKYGKLPFNFVPFSPKQSSANDDNYKAFHERNPDVKRLSWRSNNKIVVELKSGTEETYTFGDKQSMAKAEAKYGKLPSMPPVAKRDTEPITTQQNGDKIFIPVDDNDYYKHKENLPADYISFIKKNPTIDKVGWKANKGDVKAVVLFLKSGGSETYDYKDAKSMATAESKYGKLPNLFPPPPPVRVKQPGTPPPPPAEPTPPTPPTPPTDEYLPAPPPSLPADIPVYIPSSNFHDDHKAFLKRNPEVKHIGWMEGGSEKKDLRRIILILNSGATEIYDLTNDASIATAEKKYGELPGLPAPPPPVRTKQKEEASIQGEAPSSEMFKKGIEDQLMYSPYSDSKNEANAPDDYKSFMKRNPTVALVGWTFHDLKDVKLLSIVIQHRNGLTEVYNYNGKKQISAAEKKYGKLPAVPSPPIGIP